GLRDVARTRGRPAHGRGGLEGVGGALIAHAVTALGDVTGAGCRTAHRRALLVGRAGRVEAVAELRHIAAPCRLAAQRSQVARGVVVVGRLAVADVQRAGIFVVRTGRPRRLFRIVRTGGLRPAAGFLHVALTRRLATYRTRRSENVRRTAGRRPVAGLRYVTVPRRLAAYRALGLHCVHRAVGTRAVAALGRVAFARRRPAHRPGVARRVLTGDVGTVALVERAGLRVGGAGCPARLPGIGGTRVAGPVTRLGQVAVASHRPAQRAVGLHRIGRTVWTVARAGLGDVAPAGYGGAADHASGGKAVCRARGAGASAGLRHVAHAHRCPAQGAGVSCRVLTGYAAAVARVVRAGVG